MKKKSQESEGVVFKTYEAKHQSPFEKLFEIFKELITYTSGDFDENCGVVVLISFIQHTLELKDLPPCELEQL